MIKSAITNLSILESIYNSKSNQSITSLSKIYNGPTVIYHDESIGHLQTEEIESIDTYYDLQYEFFNQSDEDDVLYKVIDGKKIFRQQHQVDTLLKKLSFEKGMKVLDFGCAKGTVMKRLAKENKDIIPHLFDVSEMYKPLWEKFLNPNQYASYEPKSEWINNFDIITSFFAFEHTPNPIKELQTIRGLLKEDGLVYVVVPNIFENIGDFIVVDHVHHYSEISLTFLMNSIGFEVLEVDDQSHFAAFIIVAKKTKYKKLETVIDSDKLNKTNKNINNISNYWNELRNKIRKIEDSLKGRSMAIYGAGVYGNFIATSLENSKSIAYFIDQNPLLENTNIEGKKVVLPKNTHNNVKDIFVGLNPKSARAIIENVEAFRGKDLNFYYL